jgi:hypothetical protein
MRLFDNYLSSDFVGFFIIDFRSILLRCDGSSSLNGLSAQISFNRAYGLSEKPACPKFKHVSAEDEDRKSKFLTISFSTADITKSRSWSYTDRASALFEPLCHAPQLITNQR